MHTVISPRGRILLNWITSRTSITVVKVLYSSVGLLVPSLDQAETEAGYPNIC